MAKYKVLKDFNLNGIIQTKDAIIDLDFRLANLKSIQGNIEKVPDNSALKDSSVLSNLTPGVPLTPEQKEKLAKENATVTAEAHRLATEQRARDQAEGKGEPTVKVVADLLKDKLENEDFQSKGNLPPENALPEEVPPVE